MIYPSCRAPNYFSLYAAAVPYLSLVVASSHPVLYLALPPHLILQVYPLLLHPFHDHCACRSIPQRTTSIKFFLYFERHWQLLDELGHDRSSRLEFFIVPKHLRSAIDKMFEVPLRKCLFRGFPLVFIDTIPIGRNDPDIGEISFSRAHRISRGSYSPRNPFGVQRSDACR